MASGRGALHLGRRAQGHETMSMAYSEAELARKVQLLEAAIAAGRLDVPFAERPATYRNVAEQEAALKYFRRLLETLTPKPRRKKPKG